MGQPCVVIGVTGCIAAYKACGIVRGLQKAGVRVKVVMTEHATHFVGPTTFRALTNEKVAVDLFDDPGDPIHHISLAKEADVLLIAPCTANMMAKMAHGIADDLLSTTALATTSPILLAPAMNVNMFEAKATQDNMQVLTQRGVTVIQPEEGYLACGDVGKGHLAAVDDIVEQTLHALGIGADLAGKKILITAGPTIEPIDAVRYITNFSSGKTGYALARAAASRGADVVVVSGPVAVDAPSGVRVVPVTTADQMLEAASREFDDCDIAIFAAAVADMRPTNKVERKMKKSTDAKALQSIALSENPDILATLGARKKKQIVVGFAAETENLLENAATKLDIKNADMIVANNVGPDKAFGTDGNEVWLVTREGDEHIPFMMKRELAHVILDKLDKLALEKQGNKQ